MSSLNMLKEPKRDPKQISYNRVRFTVDMVDTLSDGEQHMVTELLLQMAFQRAAQQKSKTVAEQKMLMSVMRLCDYVGGYMQQVDFVKSTRDYAITTMKCFICMDSGNGNSLLFFRKKPTERNLIVYENSVELLDAVAPISELDEFLTSRPIYPTMWYEYVEKINGTSKWVTKPLALQ